MNTPLSSRPALSCVSRLVLASVCIALPAPVFAQATPADPPADAHPEPRSQVHGGDQDEIVVIADYVRELSLLAGQSVLGGG